MVYSNVDAVNRINISSVDIVDEPVNVLLVNARSGENKDPQNCRAHRHTFFEIHYVAKGNLTYEVDENNIDVSEDRFILITPGQMHRVFAHSDDYVKFSVAFEIDSNSEIYNILSSKRKKVFKVPYDIKAGFGFITQQADRRGAYCEMLIKKRINEMVYVLADQLSNGGSAKKKDCFDDRLLQAKKYIEDNSNEFLNCRDVARYCGVSPKQLGRIFQKYANQTVLDYIHVQKISDACKRLVNTDDLQETISKGLGFSSVHYFNKFFAQQVGMTPDEYRKNSRYGKYGERQEEEK